MGRKLLKISYLGSNYCGWQVQPNGITVQETLQSALEKLLNYKVNVSGCSRTDSGVHAVEFYCHFDTCSLIPNKGLVLGLNTLLPCDISAIDCFDVSDDFHARYNAIGKTYVYKIYSSEIRNPFYENRYLRIKHSINMNLANEYCNLITGRHDFAAFSSIHRTVSDTFRVVYDAKIECIGNEYYFSVTADGFLYNMVRILVGGLLDYSSQKITKETILNAFESGDRKLLGATVPPYGLYLQKVHYKTMQG